MWAALGAAAIGGIGSIIGGSQEAKAIKKANQAAQARFDDTKKYINNATTSTTFAPGGAAAYNNILGLLGVQQPGTGGAPQIDPATGQPIAGQPQQMNPQAGYQNFLDSAGYRTQLQSGVDAIDASASARGLRNSGATVKAAARFGQGLGASYFGNYLSQLGSAANMGLAAEQSNISGISGANAGAAGANMQAGAGRANAIGEGISGFAGNVATGITSVWGKPAGTTPAPTTPTG